MARRPAGEARVIARADWRRVALLGVVGGTLYQLLFLAGVPRTSVANAGLIFGLSPVVISLMSAAVGHEHLSWTRWAGGALSVVGLYFVVGVGATLSVNSFAGDALVFLGMLCWAVYSVAIAAAPGTLFADGPHRLDDGRRRRALRGAVGADPGGHRWAGVSWASWGLMTASSVVCLVLAYVIWYTGVQRLGATRTSAYSNLTPIAAIVVGWLWLGEPMTSAQVVGAAAILGGVFLTRLSPVVLTPLRDV